MFAVPVAGFFVQLGCLFVKRVFTGLQLALESLIRGRPGLGLPALQLINDRLDRGFLCRRGNLRCRQKSRQEQAADGGYARMPIFPRNGYSALRVGTPVDL